MKNQAVQMLFHSSISVRNIAVLIQNKSINPQPHDGTKTMKQWHKAQSVTMPWLWSSMKMLFHRSRSHRSLCRVPDHWVVVQRLPNLCTILPKQSERPAESNYSTLLPLHEHWPLFIALVDLNEKKIRPILPCNDMIIHVSFFSFFVEHKQHH